MSKMTDPKTIAKWLAEASLWISETADHDISEKHRMMMSAIDIAHDHFLKLADKNWRNEIGYRG